jgi:four helix bundle protein
MKVWEKSHELTLMVYRASAKFPKEEIYGLTSQMRRSSASIPTNIAEGSGRSTDADFQRFLQIALGSASELQYQLLLAKDLDYLAQGQYDQMATSVIEVKKMLAAFIIYLRISQS